MDFNFIIDALPHVAHLIFENVDAKTWKECPKVAKAWKKFFESNRSKWIDSTRNHPGWEDIVDLVDIGTLGALWKCFEEIKKMEDISDKEIHVVFCAILLDDTKVFHKFTRFWQEYNNDEYGIQFHWSVLIHDSKLEFSMPPFAFAAKVGSYEITKYKFKHMDELWEKERSRGSRGGDWRDPIISDYLMSAANNGHSKVVEFLLENTKASRETVRIELHIIASIGHFDVFKLLFNNILFEKRLTREDHFKKHFILKSVPFETGKIPKDEEFKTVLHKASKHGNLEIVQFLLENMEEKNPKDRNRQTPLHLASEKGHFEVVKLLLANTEVDKNPKNSDGKTPAEVAANEEIRGLFVNTITEESNLKRSVAENSDDCNYKQQKIQTGSE